MDRTSKAQYHCIFLSVTERVPVCVCVFVASNVHVGFVVLQLSLLSLFMFSKYNAFIGKWTQLTTKH